MFQDTRKKKIVRDGEGVSYKDFGELFSEVHRSKNVSLLQSKGHDFDDAQDIYQNACMRYILGQSKDFIFAIRDARWRFYARKFASNRWDRKNDKEDDPVEDWLHVPDSNDIRRVENLVILREFYSGLTDKERQRVLDGFLPNHSVKTYIRAKRLSSFFRGRR